jgi:hypothetical protein
MARFRTLAARLAKVDPELVRRAERKSPPKRRKPEEG